MTTTQALKLTHIASTSLFMACIGYIPVMALRQAGFKWWLIFSLSGHSVVAVLLLVSVYLFALFREVGQAKRIEAEHPLTTTAYYMAFYVAAPLLGGLAGTLGMLGVGDPFEFLLGVSLGTLGTTFAIWVIVDPLAALLEMLLPTSRNHRAERLARAEAQRRDHKERQEHILAEALAREERCREQWLQELRPRAERLANLLACDASGFGQAEREALNIGAEAWRLGGLSCMQQLHDMANAIFRERADGRKLTDYISYWWDGIGDWRRPSFE